MRPANGVAELQGRVAALDDLTSGNGPIRLPSLQGKPSFGMLKNLSAYLTA